MRPLPLARAGEPLKVLCLGAHSDDVEIGAGGTILSWIASGARVEALWCVFSGEGERAAEARASANAFLAGAAKSEVLLGGFRDGFFPYVGASVKEFMESVKGRFAPDVVAGQFAFAA